MKLIGSLLNCCGLFDKLCERFYWGRKAYIELVESKFGYPRGKEFEAALHALYLSNPLSCPQILKLFSLINNNRVCIIGPLYDGTPTCDTLNTIVLDSAINKIAEYNINPNIVMGDADYRNTWFDPCSITSTNRIYLVHVHGDNTPSVLWSITPCISNVVFTSQVWCGYPILGIGGFTDGDRAAVLSMGFGAREILLAGFDLEGYPIAKSKGFSFWSDVKSLKLYLAFNIINYVRKFYGYILSKERYGYRLVYHNR